MSTFDGVVIGIVDDLNDPDALGRIRVTFPWMADSVKSYWARQARLMAGADRGTFFMPERGDEALVVFEHGDARFPYVVGFLWNGVDKPPNGDIDNGIRRIRTTSGHKVDFDDRSGKEAVTITTQGGHVVDLNDASKKITVTSAGGHRITLDDTSQTVSVTTTTQHAMTMAPATVTLQFQGGGTIVMTPASLVLQHGHTITLTPAGIALA
jgi:uncharacterized protein involved in type VI secretion and phage assembly